MHQAHLGEPDLFIYALHYRNDLKLKNPPYHKTRSDTGEKLSYHVAAVIMIVYQNHESGMPMEE